MTASCPGMTEKSAYHDPAPAGAFAVGVARLVGTSGSALSGGGDLSANRTISLSASPDSSSVVGTGRTIDTTAPLSGAI